MSAPDLLAPAPPESAPDAGPQAAVEVLTFGCRLNAYESEVIRAHAGAAELGDTVVVNTCAVTGEAVRQARQAIRKARRDHPGARLVVTGCAAQIDADAFAAMPEVDAVVGNHEKLLGATWKTLTSPSPLWGGGQGVGGRDRSAEPAPHSAHASSPPTPAPPPQGGRESFNARTPTLVGDIMAVTETAGRPIDGLAERARAYVRVQNGCDHRCTFCVIPFGRGNSRSVPIADAVAQVRLLVENGHREVVLTGVDITSWGADLPGAPKLGRLVGAILEAVPELARLRLSSLDAVEIDPELYAFVIEEERVAPHLHLSLQAGDDMILKRMKRRHSRAEAIELCAALKAARPQIAFGADLIAGFPTETEAMFENSLDLVDACGLAYLHVFPFSARPGTPAARMPQLDRGLVKTRAARLRAKGEAALARHLAARVGDEAEALIERPGFGRLGDFSPVTLAGGAGAPGALARTRIVGHDGRQLLGEAVT